MICRSSEADVKPVSSFSKTLKDSSSIELSRTTSGKLLNCWLSEEAWRQAALPMSFDRLNLRTTVDFSLPAMKDTARARIFHLRARAVPIPKPFWIKKGQRDWKEMTESD
ncbi:hypothetical protein GJ496_006321 [Pomphorhynchus laevis]|nr:hypothetical protein GJ496_006321 [Pomphorhynchus laevis]